MCPLLFGKISLITGEKSFTYKGCAKVGEYIHEKAKESFFKKSFNKEKEGIYFSSPGWDDEKENSFSSQMVNMNN